MAVSYEAPWEKLRKISMCLKSSLGDKSFYIFLRVESIFFRTPAGALSGGGTFLVSVWEGGGGQSARHLPTNHLTDRWPEAARRRPGESQKKPCGVGPQ